MHTVNLIANALRHEGLPDVKTLPDDPVEEVCAVTGMSSLCYPRKSLLGASFTNLDLLKAPESNYVGEDAWIALSYKWERMSSWFCDEERFTRLERKDIRNLVISGTYPDRWSAYATTSYKKHGSLWTVVNNRRMAVWRFENINVDCTDHALLIDWWKILNEALLEGINRPVIETLTPNSFVLSSPGVNRWLEFYTWAQSRYRSCLYQFLCYLLPSHEELKNG
jgi:hypothetical protein